MTETHRRRVLLAVGSLAATTLAGCSGSEADATESDSSTTETQTSSNPTPADGSESPTTSGSTADAESADDETATGEAATTAEGLDLREANVTAVEFEVDGTTYDFSVTLYHDDDGEDGYANWWQVETLDGERLGRRELLHAHGTREFTRSETVDVPTDVTCVVVRGHDQTHGYGGQAMVVDLETGETRPFRQGPERATPDGC